MMRGLTRERVPAVTLALLAGPLSFGVAGPALVLDEVAGGLGVSIGTATWTVTAFGWGVAVGTPLMAGFLALRGVRATLTFCGLLLVAGASLVLAGPAPPYAILGCALQALGAAGLSASAMNLADSARRMGLVTAALAVVGSLAPLLGSLVSDLLSWRAALALPALSLLAVPSVARKAPPAPVGRGGFDLAGAAILTAMVTALVFVPHQPWPAGLASLAGLALLVRHLRLRPHGFVPAVLLRTPEFLISAGLAFALAMVNFSLMYAIPRELSQHSGWTSGEIGLAMLWPLLLGGSLSWFIVTASARVRPSVTVAALTGLGLAGLLVSTLTVLPAALLAAQAAASVAASSGQGVFAVRATAAVPDDHRPSAIGLFSLAYLLGSAFGPAIVSLLPI